MLTKQESKVLHDLLDKEGIKGKKALREFLWINENVPKYKVGDCFRVTDYGHSVYFGKRHYYCINFKGKIIEVRHFSNILFGNNTPNTFNYILECICNCDGKTVTLEVGVNEGDLKVKAKDNVNDLNDVPYCEY